MYLPTITDSFSPSNLLMGLLCFLRAPGNTYQDNLNASVHRAGVLLLHLQRCIGSKIISSALKADVRLIAILIYLMNPNVTTFVVRTGFAEVDPFNTCAIYPVQRIVDFPAYFVFPIASAAFYITVY